MTAESPRAVFRAKPWSGAVEAARLFSARVMRRWSLGQAEERVTAIIAELVANAVEHAGTDVEVRLSRNGEVRIEVADHDPAPPVMRMPDPLEEGGRGMIIVDRYSTQWGTDRAGKGKTVWAEVDVRPAPFSSAPAL
ncbi:ATP-binding protein [Actinocorallia longicatena]|uniref:Histidine kinase/HSP90-like ATPase domain-containing protein n=1 Tax=Actinocorallia longicatena TaxID=111803 RepID=A0ABP6Q536_9ACTN